MSTFQHFDTAQLPSIDRDALTRLERFGGTKLLHEMIALFLENARARLAAAASGIQDGDGPAIENAMHSLKSSSAQLGALRLSRLCEQAEMIARGGTHATLDPVLDECREEFASVTAWLAGVRGERPA